MRSNEVERLNKTASRFPGVDLYVFKELIITLEYKIVKRWFSTAIVGGPDLNNC